MEDNGPFFVRKMKYTVVMMKIKDTKLQSGDESFAHNAGIYNCAIRVFYKNE